MNVHIHRYHKDQERILQGLSTAVSRHRARAAMASTWGRRSLNGAGATAAAAGLGVFGDGGRALWASGVVGTHFDG